MFFFLVDLNVVHDSTVVCSKYRQYILSLIYMPSWMNIHAEKKYHASYLIKQCINLLRLLYSG
jgi:hypothetical protein